MATLKFMLQLTAIFALAIVLSMIAISMETQHQQKTKIIQAIMEPLK